jgi:hypothetical protein
MKHLIKAECNLNVINMKQHICDVSVTLMCVCVDASIKMKSIFLQYGDQITYTYFPHLFLI